MSRFLEGRDGSVTEGPAFKKYHHPPCAERGGAVLLPGQTYEIRVQHKNIGVRTHTAIHVHASSRGEARDVAVHLCYSELVPNPHIPKPHELGVIYLGKSKGERGWLVYQKTK